MLSICSTTEPNKKNHQNSARLALPLNVANLLKHTDIEFVIWLIIFQSDQLVSGHVCGVFAVVQFQHSHTGAHLLGQCVYVSAV
jgi:hypothetical protein